MAVERTRSQLRRHRGTIAAAAAAIALLRPGPSVADLVDLTLETVSEAIASPSFLTHRGHQSLYVSRRVGLILVIEDGELLAEPFLDIRSRVRGQGVTSFAFHPDFPENDAVFVHYTDLDRDSVLARFRLHADGDRLDPDSERILLEIDKEAFIHFGGQVAFGSEGHLYFSTGDTSTDEAADPACAAQTLTDLRGKLLRLDVDSEPETPPFYAVPPDNPFVVDGGRPEIWASGLRNPWRFAFDRETGDLWLADVGLNDREEVNLQTAGSAGGQNYGWKVMEGSHCRGDTSGCASPVPTCPSPALTAPVIEYGHVGAVCAIIGGGRYRGSLIPDLYGAYVYGDFCSGQIWAATEDGEGWAVQELPVSEPGLVSFGEDHPGELYVLTGQRITRLVDTSLPAAGLIELTRVEATHLESAGVAEVGVRRLGGAAGTVSVDLATAAGTASAGGDFSPVQATLTWADGEDGERSLAVPLLDDALDEAEESFTVLLGEPTGGARLGPRTEQLVRLTDDDEPSCLVDATHLCLAQGRFRAAIAWRTAGGEEGVGQAVTEGPDAGYFWFFEPTNPEVFVKLIDACVAPFDTFWVFAAGLTDLETTLEVTDTLSGEVRRYSSPPGTPFPTITDTAAFATCP